MFEYIAASVLPNMSRPEAQPFILHLANADKHPFPRYFVDPCCSNRAPKYPLILRSFDCVEHFLASPLAENTELFIYGDHLLMSGVHRHIKLFEPQYMTAILASRKKRLITKKASICDFAPTLLDLLDVDYSPRFQFETSLLAPKVVLAPDFTHFKFIYDFFREAMNWNATIQCNPGQKGFCRTT
jgi:hypothetical protein